MWDIESYALLLNETKSNIQMAGDKEKDVCKFLMCPWGKFMQTYE